MKEAEFHKLWGKYTGREIPEGTTDNEPFQAFWEQERLPEYHAKGAAPEPGFSRAPVHDRAAQAPTDVAQLLQAPTVQPTPDFSEFSPSLAHRLQAYTTAVQKELADAFAERLATPGRSPKHQARLEALSQRLLHNRRE